MSPPGVSAADNDDDDDDEGNGTKNDRYEELPTCHPTHVTVTTRVQHAYTLRTLNVRQAYNAPSYSRIEVLLPRQRGIAMASRPSVYLSVRL